MPLPLIEIFELLAPLGVAFGAIWAGKRIDRAQAEREQAAAIELEHRMLLDQAVVALAWAFEIEVLRDRADMAERSTMRSIVVKGTHEGQTFVVELAPSGWQAEIELQPILPRGVGIHAVDASLEGERRPIGHRDFDRRYFVLPADAGARLPPGVVELLARTPLDRLGVVGGRLEIEALDRPLVDSLRAIEALPAAGSRSGPPLVRPEPRLIHELRTALTLARGLETSAGSPTGRSIEGMT